MLRHVYLISLSETGKEQGFELVTGRLKEIHDKLNWKMHFTVRIGMKTFSQISFNDKL